MKPMLNIDKKKGLFHGMLLLAGLLLTGCYDSTIPISPAEDAQLDERISGRWIATDPNNEAQSVSIMALPFDDHQYYIEYCCDSGEMPGAPVSEVDTLRFRMHTSWVEGTAFANLYLLHDNEDQLYIYMRYTVSDDGELIMQTLAEDLFDEDLETSQALYDFIRQHLDNEKLYMEDESDMIFRKIE